LTKTSRRIFLQIRSYLFYCCFYFFYLNDVTEHGGSVVLFYWIFWLDNVTFETGFNWLERQQKTKEIIIIINITRGRKLRRIFFFSLCLSSQEKMANTRNAFRVPYAALNENSTANEWELIQKRRKRGKDIQLNPC